jgi:hypothetical protein
MSKSIVFIIDKTGNVKVDKVEGYGAGCLEATKLIEDRLGGAEEGTREMTEEYNEPIQNKDNQIEL